jgi:DNA-binding transcriptional ArsR family regulator
MKSNLDATFAALADPTRRAILQRLLSGEAAVTDLAKPFSLSARAVAKHVAVLEAAGLVTRRRVAQRNMTSLRGEALKDVEAWLQSYRVTWGKRFTQLGEHLAAKRGRA